MSDMCGLEQRIVGSGTQCSSMCTEEIGQLDALIDAFEKGKNALQNGDAEVMQTLELLSGRLKESQVACTRKIKEYTAELSTVSKSVDDRFVHVPEFFVWAAPDAAVDQLIAEHFYCTGDTQLGDLMEEESGCRVDPVLKESIAGLVTVVRQLADKNWEAALQWCSEHPPEESDHRLRWKCRDLTFRLHKLRITELLAGPPETAKDVVAYIQDNIGRLGVNWGDVRRLAAAALWTGRIEESPYSELLSREFCADTVDTFFNVACDVMRIPKKSHLAVCIAAGYQALPTFSKYFALCAHFAADDIQAPALGPEFTFRSTFCCPVLKRNATPDNPPTMLPCRHVLSQEALRSSVRRNRMKCPYCPMECTIDDCTTLRC